MAVHISVASAVKVPVRWRKVVMGTKVAGMVAGMAEWGSVVTNAVLVEQAEEEQVAAE